MRDRFSIAHDDEIRIEYAIYVKRLIVYTYNFKTTYTVSIYANCLRPRAEAQYIKERHAARRPVAQT
jgi:hypothetical protein